MGTAAHTPIAGTNCTLVLERIIFSGSGTSKRLNNSRCMPVMGILHGRYQMPATEISVDVIELGWNAVSSSVDVSKARLSQALGLPKAPLTFKVVFVFVFVQ
jgi:hypothetical protein